METAVLISLIVAILSPLVYAVMNIYDKYVIAHKVKNPLNYAFMAGLVQLVFGIIGALFLDWSGITFQAILFPAVAGILLGLAVPFYYLVLETEDASQVIGLIYMYPLIVALLSFIFLNEVLSLISYFGVALILVGVLMISFRMNKISKRVILLMILIMIILSGLTEFIIKIATDNIPETNGIVINFIFLGLTTSSVLIWKVRFNFIQEISNLKWACAGESLTLLGMTTLYVAMKNLPATIVSSVAATQPLFVLILERIMHCSFGKMCKDHFFLPKLIPISLIVIGVIILYATGI